MVATGTFPPVQGTHVDVDGPTQTVPLLPSAPLLPSDRDVSNQTPDEPHDVVINTATVSEITNLGDLANIPSGDIIRCIMSSLEVIYRYSSQDIQDALSGIDFTTLQELKRQLFVKLTDMFPQYKDRKLINRIMRMITKTVVTDIFNLGYSVINKGPARDLDKMFQNTPANVTEESQETNVTNIQDLSGILSMTAKLSRNVQMMEVGVKKSHDINSRLRSDLSQCQDKIEALNNELHVLKLQYESLSQNAPVDSHLNANILVRRSSGDHSYISTDDTSGFEYQRHHTTN